TPPARPGQGHRPAWSASYLDQPPLQYLLGHGPEKSESVAERSDSISRSALLGTGPSCTSWSNWLSARESRMMARLSGRLRKSPIGTRPVADRLHHVKGRHRAVSPGAVVLGMVNPLCEENGAA